MNGLTSRDRLSVVHVGGGAAGLEMLKALRGLGEDRLDLTLVAADRYFVYKPLRHDPMALDSYGRPGIPEGVATR